jgi:phosphotriesterase-related protein
VQRRSFLKAACVGLCAAPLRSFYPAPSRRVQSAEVLTVRGPVPATALGLTLPHEHVLVDFIGAAKVSPDRYNRDAVFSVVLPHLERYKAVGGQTLVECTPAYLGRDPVLLRRLAEATGLHLITNTGYYGARQDQHLPPHAFSETSDQLASRWVREYDEGIEGSGVRPGFMKIGVDGQALSEVDAKLVRAAARAHRRTGLPIAAHTGPAVAAFDQLDVLDEEGVAPDAWIWVHAQAEEDLTAHVRAAEMGAWVEFDGIRPDTIDRHVELVSNMKVHGHLGRVLVSHDAGWYHVGEPGGGTFRPFDTLMLEFVPALREAGLADQEIDQLVRVNPARAFSLRKTG